MYYTSTRYTRYTTATVYDSWVSWYPRDSINTTGYELAPMAPVSRDTRSKLTVLLVGFLLLSQFVDELVRMGIFGTHTSPSRAFRGGIGLDELDRGVVMRGGGDDLRLKSHTSYLTTISESHTSFLTPMNIASIHSHMPELTAIAVGGKHTPELAAVFSSCSMRCGGDVFSSCSMRCGGDVSNVFSSYSKRCGGECTSITNIV